MLFLVGQKKNEINKLKKNQGIIINDNKERKKITNFDRMPSLTLSKQTNKNQDKHF